MLFIGWGYPWPSVMLPLNRRRLVGDPGYLRDGALLVGVFLWQRAGMFRPVVWVGRHIRFLAAFIDRHEGPCRRPNQSFSAHLEEKRRFAWSCLWFFMGWSAGIVEVWVLLNILGLPSDLGLLYLSKCGPWSSPGSRRLFPGGLGAQEAGTVITFSFLGLSPESAMAFAVLRRLRQLGWTAVSLGCLTKLSRGKGLP